jgi:hypothetical protein
MSHSLLRGDRCQCAACGLRFKSTNAFTKHRVGSYADGGRMCLTADELRAKGFEPDLNGLWRKPFADAERARRFKETPEHAQQISHV